MRNFFVIVVFVLVTALPASSQEYDDYGNPILPRGIAPQEEGVPYQTLISSVLHKYLSGRLVDEKHIRRSVELLYKPKVAIGER